MLWLCTPRVVFVGRNATEVGVPTARMESYDIQIAHVWPECVGGGKIWKQATICERPQLNEQSNIIMTVYECSWVTIG